MKPSGQVKYDYVIVGSGIAGLYTALLARKYGSVLVITKGSIDDTNTKFAQGGIAAPIGKEDSPELNFEDTVAAGDGLCNEEAVRILVNEAADRIADLVNFSVPFDTVNGEIALTREAAHSMPRILHAGGDATGEHIETTLSGQVRSAKIRVLEDSLVTQIILENGEVTGIKVLDCRTSSVEEFGCKYLILATGGGGQLFKVNTNSSVVTGDGVALAYEAGAEITDMEFYQFHPTALHMPGVTPFLISEAVRGEGGMLRNVNGRRFMFDYTPAGELAPRDIVSRSVLAEMKKTGSDKVFLDVTHLPASRITTRFPHIYTFCLTQGLDITHDLIPVAPAAHYMIGGVKTNIWGETNIPGLYACGETACTGLHGANRLASNSLIEAMVFGKRIIKRTAEGEGGKFAPNSNGLEVHHALSLKRVGKAAQAPSRSALQQLNWDKVGIIREKQGLIDAANILASWQRLLPPPTDRPTYELNNLIVTARLMTEAALIREESRGAHFRTDFPQRLPEWQKHIVFMQDQK